MKIIYEQDNGTVAVMGVSPKSTLSLQEVAVRMVPLNKRFKIVDDSDLPDPEFADAWRVDFTTNDGTGTKQ